MKLSRREFIAVSSSLLALPLIGQDRSDLKLEKLKLSGEPDNRVNIIFIAEGYSTRSQDKFDRTVASLMSEAWSEPVLKEYAGYFNYYQIRTVSERDWDGTGDGTVFGTKAGKKNQVLELDWAKVMPLLPRGLPRRHILVLIVHNSEAVRAHGGGIEERGRLATGSVVPVFLHELGHALGLLADEYPDGGVILKKFTINTSDDENVIPWQPALERRAPGTGVFKVPGLERTFFRGEERCVMLQNEKSFGPICRWGMTLGILRYVRAIDEYGANDRPIPAQYIPALKVKLLTPVSGDMNAKWGYRQVKPDEAMNVMRSIQAKDYTLDTFDQKRGWTPLRAENDPKARTSSALLEGLPKGVSVVTCLAQDLNPWIYADPWHQTVDSRSWVVDNGA